MVIVGGNKGIAGRRCVGNCNTIPIPLEGAAVFGVFVHIIVVITSTEGVSHKWGNAAIIVGDCYAICCWSAVDNDHSVRSDRAASKCSY